MNAIAYGVVAVYLAVSIWALVSRPGAHILEDFLHIWEFSPWGKQLLVDFTGLTVVLALWMISHGIANGNVALAVGCAVVMPVFGALTPALYWLVAVAG